MSDQNPGQQPYTPPPSFETPPAASAPPPPPAGSWDPSAGAVSPAPAASTSSVPSFLAPNFMMEGTAPPAGWQPKQKMVAGLLGILLGWTGAESFYLGNTKKGVIQLVLSLITCGLVGIWGLVEGIMILIGNINTDAYGVPLTD